MKTSGQRIIAKVLVVIFLASLLIPAIAGAQQREEKVLLKEGTLVPLKLRETISSETATEGTIVDFEVTSDVKVRDIVVIKGGALAKGTISRVEKAKFAGQEGKVQLSLESVKAVDDSTVPLRATVSRGGEERQVLAIGGAILCLPLILVRGTEGVIGSGTEFRGYVAGDREIVIVQKTSGDLLRRFLAWLFY